jgi:hypothetical protein
MPLELHRGAFCEVTRGVGSPADALATGFALPDAV